MDQLAHSTVRLESRLPDGAVSIGTGFFYYLKDDKGNHHVNIVTNRHVVEDAIETTFLLSLADDDGNPIEERIFVTLEEKDQTWIGHPDKDIDLCCMPLTPLLNSTHKKGIKLSMKPIWGKLDGFWLDKLSSVEEVLMVGYPNGIWDQKNNRPIFRRGITATHFKYDYNGKQEFLIDIACFGGSSGSPVFWYRPQDNNPLPHLIGILYAGMIHTAEGDIKVVEIPTGKRPVAYTEIPNNLGIAIKADCLAGLESEFVKFIQDIRKRYENAQENNAELTK